MSLMEAKREAALLLVDVIRFNLISGRKPLPNIHITWIYMMFVGKTQPVAIRSYNIMQVSESYIDCELCIVCDYTSGWTEIAGVANASFYYCLPTSCL